MAATGAIGHKAGSRTGAASTGEEKGGGEKKAEDGARGAPADECVGPEARIKAYLRAVGEGRAKPVQDVPDPFPLPTEPVHVVIATIPDPFATRLDYQFDLIASALQQAAEVDGYTFDRYGLSWDLERSRDLNLSQTIERCPRAQPGVLIFRKDVGKGGRRETLLVFLVGETPTAGVHPDALDRSIWLAKSYARPTPNEVEPIRIVGPTYSGSAESLGRILDGYADLAFRIVAGGATGPNVAALLSERQSLREEFTLASHREPGVSGVKLTSVPRSASRAGAVAPRTFVRTAHVYQSLRDEAARFLDRLGIENAQVALLVEQTTTAGVDVAGGESSKYDGTGKQSDGTTPTKPWRVVRFPLHVSQVRRAFESGRVDPGKAKADAYELPRLLLGLRPDHVQRPGEVLRNFSDATDNYDELMLGSELSAVCRSRIRAIGIAATDGRDRRFLVGKVRQLCPDALPFTFGGDLLFAYPDEQEALSGTVIFSSYPLFLPVRSWGEIDDQGRPIKPPPLEQFGDSLSAAVYNAMIVQLEAWEDQSVPGAHDHVGQRDQPAPKMLDYGCPIRGDAMRGQLGRTRAPPIWISLASRDGLLPLDVRCDIEAEAQDHVVPATAAIEEETTPADPTPNSTTSPSRPNPKGFLLSFGRVRTLFFALMALSVYAVWLTIRWRPRSSLPPSGNFLRAALFLLSFAVLAALVLEIRLCAERWPPKLFFWKWVMWPIGPVSAGISGACVVVAATMAVMPRRASSRRAPYAAAIVVALVLLAGIAAPRLFEWVANGLVPDYQVLLLAQRATYITSGVSPLVPLLVLAGIIHYLLYVFLRRSSLGGKGSAGEGPFGPLFGNAPPPTIGVADGLIRALTRCVPGREECREFLGLILVLAFATFVALRNWSPTPEGAWFDDLFRWAFGLVILTIAAAGLRSVRLWLALRSVLQRVARHPLQHALRKLPRHVPKSSFTHLLFDEPKVRELDGSMDLLSRCGPARWGPTGSEANEVAKEIKSGADRRVWASPRFEGHRKIAADLASDETLQARWHAPGTTAEAKRPQPAELFIARQFTLTVAWVVAHIRLQLKYLMIGSLGILLAASSYAFPSTRLLTLTVWIVVLLAATTATWLVLDFNRTEVAAWMMGARAGKMIDWKLAGHLVTVAIVPLLALVAFQFPTIGQWLSSSLGPVLHAFGSVAGGGGE